MSGGIRIDDLDPTVLQSLQHEVPAMRDGISVKLTVDQILSLLSSTDHAAKRDLSNVIAPQFTGNLNSILYNGVVTTTNTTTNRPTGDANYRVATEVNSSGLFRIQRAWQLDAASQIDTLHYIRVDLGDGFLPWQRDYVGQDQLDARYMRKLGYRVHDRFSVNDVTDYSSTTQTSYGANTGTLSIDIPENATVVWQVDAALKADQGSHAGQFGVGAIVAFQKTDLSWEYVSQPLVTFLITGGISSGSLFGGVGANGSSEGNTYRQANGKLNMRIQYYALRSGNTANVLDFTFSGVILVPA